MDVRNGLPRFCIVGLPDTAVRESRERVLAALRNSGFEIPPKVITVNLAPADIRKEGNFLDLPIAAALLAALGYVPEKVLERRLFCSELALDGALRPIRGALAAADLAARMQTRELLVAPECAREAAALDEAQVIGLPHISGLVEHLCGRNAIVPTPAPNSAPPMPLQPDIAEVHGQVTAKRALEIAAAGGHNLLFIGPPGCGKSLLASCLPGILPDLSRQEALTATRIHSIASATPLSDLVRRRPFRRPHCSISTAGLLGGGSVPRPGEVSLAHHGILFLDELPEFRRQALEGLRQPLEDGRVTISRAQGSCTFPARIQLVAAQNPCPCGFLGHPKKECRCTQPEIVRYRSRVSGPLLDRVDLHVEVGAVAWKEIDQGSNETSEKIRERVVRARNRQQTRQGDGMLNRTLKPEQIRRYCTVEDEAQSLLNAVYERLGLSVRALHRTQKVARTIADLAESDVILAPHVAEALHYRTLDPAR